MTDGQADVFGSDVHDVDVWGADDSLDNFGDFPPVKFDDDDWTQATEPTVQTMSTASTRGTTTEEVFKTPKITMRRPLTRGKSLRALCVSSDDADAADAARLKNPSLSTIIRSAKPVKQPQMMVMRWQRSGSCSASAATSTSAPAKPMHSGQEASGPSPSASTATAATASTESTASSAGKDSQQPKVRSAARAKPASRTRASRSSSMDMGTRPQAPPTMTPRTDHLRTRKHHRTPSRSKSDDNICLTKPRSERTLRRKPSRSASKSDVKAKSERMLVVPPDSDDNRRRRNDRYQHLTRRKSSRRNMKGRRANSSAELRHSHSDDDYSNDETETALGEPLRRHLGRTSSYRRHTQDDTHHRSQSPAHRRRELLKKNRSNRSLTQQNLALLQDERERHEPRPRPIRNAAKGRPRSRDVRAPSLERNVSRHSNSRRSVFRESRGDSMDTSLTTGHIFQRGDMDDGDDDLEHSDMIDGVEFYATSPHYATVA